MPTVTLSVGDTHQPLTATLLDAHGDPIDLTDARRVRFELGPEDDPLIDRRAEIIDRDGARVRYEWREGDTETPGTHRAVFVVSFRDGSTQVVPTGDDPFFVSFTTR